MGKLICDSTTSSPVIIPWKDPTVTPSSPIESIDFTSPVTSSWDDVSGLEDQQRRHLQRLQSKGILWKHPNTNKENNKDDDDVMDDVSMTRSAVFRLSHGGDVDSDGNCLFTASRKAMGLTEMMTAKDLRKRTVKRFLDDVRGDVSGIDDVIKNMYASDMRCGWGIHVVQEIKLLAPKVDRQTLDDAIIQLVNLGMQRELAAESIYKERCIAVDNGENWAKYMSISGSPDDEYDIITLQYTEEGLLTVDENREGHAAAFGDDIAIECLATEFKREIYVVQAHGSDAMVDEDNCVFFLPHRPRSEICGPPFFLFMKGTGWCGAGGDHYEPLIAHSSSVVSQEKVAMVL